MRSTGAPFGGIIGFVALSIATCGCAFGHAILPCVGLAALWTAATMALLDNVIPSCAHFAIGLGAASTIGGALAVRL